MRGGWFHEVRPSTCKTGFCFYSRFGDRVWEKVGVSRSGVLVLGVKIVVIFCAISRVILVFILKDKWRI